MSSIKNSYYSSNTELNKKKSVHENDFLNIFVRKTTRNFTNRSEETKSNNSFTSNEKSKNTNNDSLKRRITRKTKTSHISIFHSIEPNPRKKENIYDILKNITEDDLINVRNFLFAL